MTLAPKVIESLMLLSIHWNILSLTWQEKQKTNWNSNLTLHAKEGHEKGHWKLNWVFICTFRKEASVIVFLEVEGNLSLDFRIKCENVRQRHLE